MSSNIQWPCDRWPPNRYSLSKCCACSIRNCEPCSHCRSSSCSRLCGVLPCAVAVPLPLSMDANDGPCGCTGALRACSRSIVKSNEENRLVPHSSTEQKGAADSTLTTFTCLPGKMGPINCAPASKFAVPYALCASISMNS